MGCSPVQMGNVPPTPHPSPFHNKILGIDFLIHMCSHTCRCGLQKLYICMLIVYIYICSPLSIKQHVYQGRRKPFISGQAKVGSEHYSVECVDDVVSLIGLYITLPFCLLLSFLHDRIPCKHNAWVPNNLEPLYVFSIYYSLI